MSHFCPTCEQQLRRKNTPHVCRPKAKSDVPSQDGSLGFINYHLNPTPVEVPPKRMGPGYPNDDGGDISLE